jgi:NADH:ubiquinone oxidoreductase subunit F (NADH-binding)/NADH:ubiquinone oxidoreductase subunit E/Pyruvate/2-oxoacid:ferredoxin oxidoreductase delta subunit
MQSLVDRHGGKPHALVAILLSVQKKFGYLPADVLELIPQMTQISADRIKGVITFYSFFRLRPAGKHRINVCVGTACYVKGAELTFQAFKKDLKIADDDDTDPDRRFTIGRVACIGCCMLAPAIQIDDSVYGYVEPSEINRVIGEFEKSLSEKKHEAEFKISGEARGEVKICLCSSCIASGAGKIYAELLRWAERFNFPVKNTMTGCTGVSFAAPLIEITDQNGNNFFYSQINPENLQPVLQKHFPTRGLQAGLENLIYIGQEPASQHIIASDSSPARVWLSKKHHLVMQGCMDFPPCDFKSYKKNDGFSAYHKARQLTPEALIKEISDSGLRGRGGAGYPTGLKWQQTAAAQDQEKFIVCNADEGDPGAFMDRMLLESVPFRVIEGMMIGALAIGAQAGYIFVRHEYPLAVARIQEAISLCQQNGLLTEKAEAGKFSLHIVESAGAFVCGEETALIAAIEGERGIPRERPPYPSEKGLFKVPTLINNVETFACVPWIIKNSAAAFKKTGSKSSSGTKTFALAGKVKQGGLIEVPMGTTIREIINEIGNGVAGNGTLKAVQIGGPSGGCLPESMFDLPIDFEALTASGAIMGSGGLVVLDNSDCMVDIARYFLEFTADESCGNCSFCRIGSQKLLDILNRLCNKEGRQGDIEKLQELSQLLVKGSRCGLGRTAPNPVLTTINYFRNEYEQHIKGFCPAGKCSKMFRFVVNDDCNGCTICARGCPVDAIPFAPWEKAEIDAEECVRCGVCRQNCPQSAIEVAENE